MPTASLDIPRLGEPLKLWEKLELVVGEGTSATVFKTRIEDFRRDSIIVSQPQAVKGSWGLKYNSLVTVIITRDIACYQFRGYIRILEDSPEHFYILDRPQQVDRIQRRRSARIELRSNVRFFDLEATTDWSVIELEATWAKGRSANVSAHGVLLLPDGEAPPVGHRLLLNMDWFREIDLPGPIFGICRRAFTENDRAFAGIEFLIDRQLPDFLSTAELALLPSTVRDFTIQSRGRLMTRVFQRQIEMRKKGLL